MTVAGPSDTGQRAVRVNFRSDSFLGYATTIEDVRHYTIKMMNGFSVFKCPLCKHSVTTREFSSKDGNCRTQAARAMNQHATAVHGRQGSLSSPDAPMWHAY
jgi:hypothetical protein